MSNIMKWIQKFWQWLKRLFWTVEEDTIVKKKTYYGAYGKQEVMYSQKKTVEDNFVVREYNTPDNIYGIWIMQTRHDFKGHHRFHPLR